VAYWVKIYYERNEYVVNFERVSAFCHERNGRITFWLPNSGIPIVVNPQNNFEDYTKILDYIKYATGQGFENTYWVKILDDRKEYVVNLDSISSFCYEPNGRITFWLPDSTIPIIINPTSNTESYGKVMEYIHKTTGYEL
jgi:hypothetical protein